MPTHPDRATLFTRPLLRLTVTVTIALGLVAWSALGLADRAQSAPSTGLRGGGQAHVAAGDRLFDRLRMAGSEAEARAITDQIWQYWLLAPDEPAAALMGQALDRRGRNDIAGALAILDELVALAPNWAEGWNQRATLRFVIHDYDGSLADIKETLDREPRHFGALSGKVMILLRLGRADEAQSVLRLALTIHPFLPERRLVIEPPGKDI
ncbi:MAG: hypothetical protein GY798_18485 [Hyphomicrobiales bacterium]|nr:hypothetical protein [Hyphomicrobiales bacterium]